MSSVTINSALSGAASTPPPPPSAPAMLKATEVEMSLDESGTDVIKWCFENKQAIVALQSSATESKIFEVECIFCSRWYRHCMFSNSSKKRDAPMCRWCALGPEKDEQGRCRIDMQERNQFEIHMHIHCNRGGKKLCTSVGYPYSLDQVPVEVAQKKVYQKEKTLEEIARKPEGPEFVIKKKMSQKERKAANKAAAQAMGL